MIIGDLPGAMGVCFAAGPIYGRARCSPILGSFMT